MFRASSLKPAHPHFLSSHRSQKRAKPLERSKSVYLKSLKKQYDLKNKKKILKKGHLCPAHTGAPSCLLPHFLLLPGPTASASDACTFPRFRCWSQWEAVGGSGLELDTVLRRGAVQKTEITTAQPPGKYTQNFRASYQQWGSRKILVGKADLVGSMLCGQCHLTTNTHRVVSDWQPQFCNPWWDLPEPFLQP